MAIRRAKQKAQVIAQLETMAPEGELFLATVHTETGPSPWLLAVLDEIPLVSLVVMVIMISRRFYFLTLTNTSVIVNTASRLTNRPGPVVAVFARNNFPVTKYKRGTVWSRFYVQFPNASKPTRLNVHRYWRRELDALAEAFPAAGQAPIQPGGPVTDIPGPAA